MTLSRIVRDATDLAILRYAMEGYSRHEIAELIDSCSYPLVCRRVERMIDRAECASRDQFFALIGKIGLPGDPAPLFATFAPPDQRTHCANGHALTPENTYIHPNGYRRCRACQRERDEARRRRQWLSAGVSV